MVVPAAGGTPPLVGAVSGTIPVVVVWVTGKASRATVGSTTTPPPPLSPLLTGESEIDLVGATTTRACFKLAKIAGS